MTNLVWYLFIAIIGVVISAHTIYVKRHKFKVSTLIVFYLFATGITWLGEFTVLGLFDSYVYKTGLFVDPWAQNLLGHLILNITLYPAIAIVCVAYGHRYWGIGLTSALFVFIEYLFVKMGLYEHHWWRYYMTGIVVIVYLLFSKYWYPEMVQRPYGFVRNFTYYFVALVIIHIPSPVLLLLGKQHYQMGFVNNMFDNFYLSSIIIVFFYHMILCFVAVLCTCVLKKWYWPYVPLLFPLIVQSILGKVGILVIEEGWSLVYTIVIYELFIAIYVLLEKYTLKDRYRIKFM